MQKLPKAERMKWVTNELKEVEDYADELRKFSRSMVYDSKFTPRVDVRPDEGKEN